ncbi:MAG TPA: glycosyltransferase, partial [Gammaproteobacteria bacterium]|nr:glycosyltransferase [Gammaproteobacteria bacterium]
MRIAQIMLGKNFGGAERSFVDMCQALGSKGHDVLAICERRSKAVTFVEQIEGLTSKTVIVRGSWDPFARRKIKRHLEIFDADVVQMHLARSAQMAGPAARLLGIPSVAKTHNYVNLKYYESISKLVPTTRRQEVYLRSQGVPEDRISRIPNFSSIPPKPPKTEPTNWSSGVLQVVGLGRLVHKKGFDLFLRAVAAARRDGLKLAVTIAGAGPESGALMRLRRDLGLEKVVTFLGWQDDVQTYLSKADVFVLPSRDEPFGIVCLEAMASCLPIIATRTHGPTEILNEDTAILVEPGDSTGLTKALQRIAREPRQAAQRAVAAQQHFKQNFSVNAVLSQYLELYKGL